MAGIAASVREVVPWRVEIDFGETHALTFRVTVSAILGLRIEDG